MALKEWKQIPSAYERKAMQREIDIQKSLHHPNCLNLYGMSVTPKGTPALLMELGDGCLTDYTTKQTKPRLSNQQKCQIILEIAQGLEYIHSKGCIHRDIKLDNILMKDGHPKIADFGLARSIDPSRSMEISFAGSPVFMAPELIMQQRVTNLVDVYSFGCIVNEIMSEKVCYWDYKIINAGVFYRDVREGLRPTIVPGTPMEVKELISDCFKNKRCRPNMESLVRRIRYWDPSQW